MSFASRSVAGADHTAPSRRSPFRATSKLISDNVGIYVLVNLVGYGLLVVGAALGSVVPGVHDFFISATEKSLSVGPLSSVVGGYLDGNIVVAALGTFVVNLVVASILLITVPSLVVPFSGLLLIAYQGINLGAVFAPAYNEQTLSLRLHYVTVAVEWQAYLIVALIAVVQGRMVLQPNRFGLPSRTAAWRAGVRTTLRCYPLVIVILAVAAVYEAVTLIWFG